MNIAARSPDIVAAQVPRSIGEARLSVQARDGSTHVAGLRQAGCLKVLLPRTFRPDLEAVLVNTAGGVTGGDRFAISADVAADAEVTMTSQAAERMYRAVGAAPATIETDLTVAPGARVNWVPQETILFDGAKLHRRLRVSLAEGASALICESLVFGRVLMGEEVHALTLSDRIAVDRVGVDGPMPLYRDGIEMDAGQAQLMRSAVAQGARAVSQVVFVAPEAEAHLAALRAALPTTGGASLLAPDMIVLRLVAADSFELRAALLPVLDRLMGGRLPGCWRM